MTLGESGLSWLKDKPQIVGQAFLIDDLVLLVDQNRDMGVQVDGTVKFHLVSSFELWGLAYTANPTASWRSLLDGLSDFSIQQNATTQREIFSLFGEPYRKGVDSGFETWTYSYHTYELGQLRDSKELYVVFNKDGTVRSYSFTSK